MELYYFFEKGDFLRGTWMKELFVFQRGEGGMISFWLVTLLFYSVKLFFLILIKTTNEFNLKFYKTNIWYNLVLDKLNCGIKMSKKTPNKLYTNLLE